MEPFSTTLILSIVTFGILVFFIYDKFRFKDVWSKHGVRQPNISVSGIFNYSEKYNQVFEKHGDTIGTRLPGLGLVLLSRDTELLRPILVKDFNNFVNRTPGYADFYSKSSISKSVFFARDMYWKRVRRLVTPSFSTAKLKAMLKPMEDSAVKLTQHCVSCAMTGQLVSVKTIAAHFSSEIIARTAFGVETESFGKDQDEFTRYARKIFRMRSKLGMALYLSLKAFPGLLKLCVESGIEYLDPVCGDSHRYFSDLLLRVLPERKQLERNGANKPADLLQTLVAASDENMTRKSPDSLSLSDEEIIGQSMLIIFAAFETTASSLQMILYLLAQHPDVQEKVYQECQSVVQTETPTYEELGQLKYMDQVIHETLRLFTIIPVLTRQSKETRTYGDVTIPKDTMIVVPVASLHMDPKHWQEPDKFDPERFSEENKSKRDPLAYMPFGCGPRHCIGTRLAVLELKSVLVHLVRKVEFQLNEKTHPKPDEKVQVNWNNGLLIPEKHVQLACLLRNEASSE